MRACFVVFALALVVGAGCQNASPDAPLLLGTTRGRPGDTLNFTARAVDSDGDAVSCNINWDDGEESGWSELVASGEVLYFKHAFADSGEFGVSGRSHDASDTSAWSDSLWVRVRDYGPKVPRRPTTTGPDTVVVLDTVHYVTSADHLLDERVALQFDWGDTLGEWSAYVAPGTWVARSHVYMEAGIRAVRARARDSLDHVSDWSNPCTVHVTP
jgi:hypothetical protein